jgi:predicted phosphodiesterase
MASELETGAKSKDQVMFNQREPRRRGMPLPFTIFRLLISVVLFIILGLAIIQAFKYFAGTTTPSDPITKAINQFPDDPKGAIMGLLTSEDTVTMLGGLLSFSPAKNLNLPLIKTPEKSILKNRSTTGNTIFRFALVADSHKDTDELAKALFMAKAENAKFVIGLGDFSEVGTKEELEASKKVFDEESLPYYIIPGDHDLWESRDSGQVPQTRFSQIFSLPYQAFSDSGIRFIMINNADNYNGLDDLQLDWLKGELTKASEDKENKGIYVFLHEPIVHPTSDQLMGSVKKTGLNGAQSEKIQLQAKELLELFKKTGVAGVFAGDIHAFTSYVDQASGIPMVTVGALTKERNTQAPRFSMVDVFDSGGYNISDIEVK